MTILYGALLGLIFAVEAPATKPVPLPRDTSEENYITKPNSVYRRQTRLYWSGIVVGERRYYHNDQLGEERLLKDGQLDGLQRRWHENGRPWEEQTYRNGA